MQGLCDKCERALSPVRLSDDSLRLLCSTHNRPCTGLDISAYEDELFKVVCRKTHFFKANNWRCETPSQNVEGINIDGRGAELTAVLLLCPQYVDAWVKKCGNDRGRDIPVEWTELDKPVEVKHTLWHDDRRGYLLVRPPRSDAAMAERYINDCYYVLFSGQFPVYYALGWADRERFLNYFVRDPVPRRRGQSDCWGVHWRHLLPPAQLFCL